MNVLFNPEQVPWIAAMAAAGYGLCYGVIVAVLPRGSKATAACVMHAGLFLLALAALAMGAYCRFTGKPGSVTAGYALAGAVCLVAALCTLPLIRRLGGGACVPL